MRASLEARGDTAGPWVDAWQRLRRNPMAIASGAALAGIAFLCFVVPWLAGLDPFSTNPAARHTPPGVDYWLGSDAIGRDLLARLLVGGRTSLLVGVAATAVSLGIGIAYGGIAGYIGGRVDELMMRIVDFLYGLPYMFLVILVMLLFSESARGEALPIFLALGLVQWLTMARIVRGEVLALRDREFVLAAQLLGASDARVLLRHVLPNAAGTIVVYATLTIPSVIILESFLSFLGLGVSLSWGQLVAEGVQVVNPVQSYWWLLLWPSLALAATLFALNALGDALRDAIDPRSLR